MKNSQNTTLSLEEKKAKKAAANKLYRERKKAETAKEFNWKGLEKFEHAFDHKIRLYKNLKLEPANSYLASPKALLKFEVIKNENNNTTVFRVRRTGRRTFFTTSLELAAK